jgi:hypothetical protein
MKSLILAAIILMTGSALAAPDGINPPEANSGAANLMAGKQNRTVALAKVHGPGAGLEALDGIRNTKALRRYYLFHAVRAELFSESGRHAEAEQSYRQALALTELPAERNFLQQRALREGKLK